MQFCMLSFSNLLSLSVSWRHCTAVVDNPGSYPITAHFGCLPYLTHRFQGLEAYNDRKI